MHTAALQVGTSTFVAMTRSINVPLTFLFQSVFIHLPALHQWIGGLFVLTAVTVTVLQERIRTKLAALCHKKTNDETEGLLNDDEDQK